MFLSITDYYKTQCFKTTANLYYLMVPVGQELTSKCEGRGELPQHCAQTGAKQEAVAVTGS